MVVPQNPPKFIFSRKTHLEEYLQKQKEHIKVVTDGHVTISCFLPDFPLQKPVAPSSPFGRCSAAKLQDLFLVEKTCAFSANANEKRTKTNGNGFVKKYNSCYCYNWRHFCLEKQLPIENPMAWFTFFWIFQGCFFFLFLCPSGVHLKVDFFILHSSTKRSCNPKGTR